MPCVFIYSGMEEIVRHCPQHINARKDNDSTPLHVAVTNHHCDVVSLLASHVSERDFLYSLCKFVLYI